MNSVAVSTLSQVSIISRNCTHMLYVARPKSIHCHVPFNLDPKNKRLNVAGSVIRRSCYNTFNAFRGSHRKSDKIWRSYYLIGSRSSVNWRVCGFVEILAIGWDRNPKQNQAILEKLCDHLHRSHLVKPHYHKKKLSSAITSDAVIPLQELESKIHFFVAGSDCHGDRLYTTYRSCNM